MELINLQSELCIPVKGVFLVTFTLILLAEMGDKSQLLAIALTTRYKLRQVFLGIALSIIALNALAVFMGSLITSIIPMTYIQIFASVLFIVFGLLSFRNEDENVKNEKVVIFSPTLTIGITFFIAELGDKTQLTTMILAAKYNAPVKVLIASTLGMLLADMIGVIAGVALNKYVPHKIMKTIGGIIFFGFGVFGLTCFIPSQQISTIINSLAIVIGVVAIIVLTIIYKKPKQK